jgi:ribosome-binding protein aMBF1 (putative translation factor)
MGGWRDVSRRWWETSVINCSLCGQLIVKEAWVESRGSEDVLYCSQKCAEFASTYNRAGTEAGA